MCKGVRTFILLVGFLIGSQLSLSAEIFAPFVSGLSVSVSANTVSMSWKPAPSGIAVYDIYRSTESFSEESFDRAVKIGSVSSDMSTYTDYPPTTDNYYYAVLGRSDDNTLYKLFIPYRNITVAPVAVETTDSMKAVATKISQLTATPTDDAIRLDFESSKPNREVIIYRSNSSIQSQQDLIEANAIATISSQEQQYTDFPLGGISYYYAVVDAEMAKAGSYDFRSGENSLAEPVELPVGTQISLQGPQTETRITPLPYLLLNNGSFAQANFSRPSAPLNEGTQAVWKKLNRRLSSGSAPSAASPDILPLDRTDQSRQAGQSGTGSSAQNSDQQLAQIVNSSFPEDIRDRSAWQNAEKQLGAFFNISRTDSVETRAHYYMGQVYFFQKKYKQAFFEFLMAQEEFYAEVQPWLHRIYPELLLLDS